MKHGLPWYKHSPRDFIDGIQGLGPDVIGAYIVLLDLIYARGGETKRDDHHLAGILGCSKRLATSLTDRLIDAGKISFQSGFVSNSRAENEVAASRSEGERKANAQRERREREAEQRKIKDIGDNRSGTKPYREDKIREDKKESIKDAPAARPKSAPKRAAKLPEDFAPDLQSAIDEGLQPQEAILSLARFKDHAQANGRVQIDWPAAWRLWYRGDIEKKNRGRSSQAQAPRPETPHQQHQRTAKEAFKRAVGETEHEHPQHVGPDIELERSNYRAGPDFSRGR